MRDLNAWSLSKVDDAHSVAIVFVAHGEELIPRFGPTVQRLQDEKRDVHVVSAVRCSTTAFVLLSRAMTEGAYAGFDGDLSAQHDKDFYDACAQLDVPPENIHIYLERPLRNTLSGDAAMRIVKHYQACAPDAMLVAPSPYPWDATDHDPAIDDMALGCAVLACGGSTVLLVGDTTNGTTEKASTSASNSNAQATAYLASALFDTLCMKEEALASAQAHNAELTAANATLQARIAAIEGSTSFKAGLAVTAVPRKMKSAITRRR